MDHPEDEPWFNRLADKAVSESDVSELELCKRIHTQDPQAESVLVERLQPGLRLILRRATGGDIELARDLLQETLTIIILRLRSTPLNDPAGLPAFAAQTARHLAFAHARKQNRQRTRVDLEAIDAVEDNKRDQSATMTVERLSRIVHRLLDELSMERDRIVLRRYYLEEEDKQVICHDLSLSELALNQVLFRARQRFRVLLDDAGFRKEDVLDLDLPS
jgi:RNA polymerase sigma-70 factor (ECF subfamily)